VRLAFQDNASSIGSCIYRREVFNLRLLFGEVPMGAIAWIALRDFYEIAPHTT